VQYARTVRGSTMVERNKDYVQAARLIGVPGRIMLRHVLPNVLGPVLVIATINLGARDHHRGDAVVPRRRHAADHAVARHADPHRQQFLFSGEWWIVAFPRRSRWP
jgi:peptide/nickel transport system permease protein